MQTQAEKIKQQILSSDIILRDSSSFVHSRKTGRLGWEKDIAGRSLSSFATDARTQEEAIQKAYSLAGDMLSVMNIPQRVAVRIDPHGRSATNARDVWVSTKHFDEKSIDLGQKLDIFIGLAVHEGCHLLYTDWKTGGSAHKLVHTIANLLEDERIENIVGEEKPGLAGFLAQTKGYYFGRHEKTAASKTPDRLRDAVNAVIKLVRFPSSLTDREFEDFGELLLKVRDILTPYPTSTEETYEKARVIFNILKDMFKDEAKSKKSSGAGKGKPKDDSKQEDDSSSDAGSDSEDNGPGQESGDGEKQNDDEQEGDSREQNGSGSDNDEQDEEEDREGSGQGDDEGEDSGNGNSEQDDNGSGTDADEADENGSEGNDGEAENDDDAEADAELDKEIADSLNELAGDFDDLTTREDERLSDEETSSAVNHDRNIEGLCTGRIEKGADAHTFFYPVDRTNRYDENLYQESMSRVGPYVNAVRRFLQYNATESRFSLKGMRSGHLDTSKLAEAMQGSQNIYVQEHECTTDKIAVCLLIDQSGSMCSNVRTKDGTRTDRITVARDTAILLDEALSKVPNIELFVYGHTADHNESSSVEIFTYRDRKNKTRHALGCCRDHSNNADGYAILETARRIRRQTDRKCLMFVISDGLPAAELYSGIDGVKHTAQAVRTVEKMDFSVIQIAISAELDPKLMFDKYVVFEDLSELPRELGQMVKKAVLENARRKAA